MTFWNTDTPWLTVELHPDKPIVTWKLFNSKMHLRPSASEHPGSAAQCAVEELAFLPEVWLMGSCDSLLPPSVARLDFLPLLFAWKKHQKSKFKTWFLFSVYCFRSIIKREYPEYKPLQGLYKDSLSTNDSPHWCLLVQNPRGWSLGVYMLWNAPEMVPMCN